MFKLSKFRNIILIYFFYHIILLSINTEARFANPDETDVIYSNIFKQVKINENYSYEEDILIEKKYSENYLKYDAKNYLKFEKISFNPWVENIEILEVKNKFNYINYSYTQKQLDELNQKIQKLSAVARTEIKEYEYDKSITAEIKYPMGKQESNYIIRYKRKIFNPKIKNFFNHVNLIGYNSRVDNYRIRYQIPSEFNFHLKIQDPEYKIIRYQNFDEKYKIYDFRISSPIYKSLVNEDVKNLDDSDITIINLSSDFNCSKIANEISKYFSNNYFKKYDLNDNHKNIIETANKLNSKQEKIEFLIKKLKSEFKIDNIVRTYRGKIKPKSLEQIYKSKNLDIKDFVLLLSYLLNKSGVESEISFIKKTDDKSRYIGTFPLAYMPDANYFNYSLLKVKTHNSNYYIDPLADFHYYGINAANIYLRPALDPNSTEYPIKYIPTASVDNREEYRVDSIILSKEHINILTNLYLSSNSLIDFFNEISKINISNYIHTKIISNFSYSGNTRIFSTFPEYKIEKGFKNNIKFSVQFIVSKDKNSDVNKDNIYSFEIYRKEIIDQIINYDKNDGYIFMNNSGMFVRKTIFQNLKIKDKSISDADIQSKWIYYKRRINKLKNNTEITESYIIYQPYISKNEMNSKSFLDFKEKITNERNLMINFQR